MCKINKRGHHTKFVRWSAICLIFVFWLACGLVHASPGPMPTRPAQDERSMTNPPVFTWPWGKGPFNVEIESSSGDRIVRQTVRNWLTLEHPLPVGQYRWRWQSQGSQPTPWLNFRMVEDAVDFPILGVDELLHTVRSQSRPRSVSVEALRRHASPRTIANLRNAVNKWRIETLPDELAVPGGPLSASIQNELHTKNRRLVFGEEHRVLASAWLWLATGDTSAMSEAKRRAMHVASWDATGMTSFEHHDQAGRSVAWMLALVFDWLHDQLSNDERQALLKAINPRLAGMLGRGSFGIDNSFRLDRNPFDSHGVTAIALSSLICAVLAGEDAIYDQYFKDVLPRYLAMPFPWGWEHGGFANGTAYAHWALLGTYLPVFSLLGQTLGMDLMRHPWIRGHGNFITYFLPPGTPSGLFGDEVEKLFTDVWATQAKAYAASQPSPLVDWYARNSFGENPLHFALMLAPSRNWTQIPEHFPPDIPHSIHLSDIGWVAMHSNLGDRSRTSVYFKSSPYGSYNHSHADQNSFVIHARGQVLAADSGYYDFYNSLHWKDWYKQTRAHNAITFDGGQGQLYDTMAAKGKITHFEHNEDYDITTGDATEAYGGALTRAVRSVVYLRPGTILVHDSLASETPRTWEWNLHSLSKMKQNGSHELKIDQDGVGMCVALLDAPEGEFAQTDRFTTEPQGNYPRQWHARYATHNKSERGYFLALLDVNCGKPDVRFSKSGDQSILKIEGKAFTFSESGDVKRIE